jgi:hypothetical protein
MEQGTQREILTIKRKALKINLEGMIYGTFAEIGAGQEVARTFFQVGGASSTVAKTMSAYDMAFSDAIYGEETGGRYVSESRVIKMLDHEYGLLEERLHGAKYEHRRFFAFADTCATINFRRDNDPHCWIGLKFQLSLQGPVNEVIIHIRLKEIDAIQQQRTIGGLGVNLIYACYWHHDCMDDFVASLMDNLSHEQAEIDMIRIKGADFASVDNRLLALMLVRKGFTSGTIFGPDREVHQPKDFLYKKNLLCLRGRFRPITRVTQDMFAAARSTFQKEHPCSDDALISIAELTLNGLDTDDKFADKDFLDRADILCSLGHTVMVSNCQRHDALVSYLRRCRPDQMCIVQGVMNLMDIFDDTRYADPHSEILHYFGEVFQINTKMLIYPYQPTESDELVTLRNFKVSDTFKPLYEYLMGSGFMIDIEGYDPEVLHIFAQDVIQLIKSASGGWEDQVPPTVADYIKDHCLFDYPCVVR